MAGIRSILFVFFTLVNFVTIVLLYNHFHPLLSNVVNESSTTFSLKYSNAKHFRTFELDTNGTRYIGLENQFKSIKVATFLGIAYAKPPMGKLRHQAPEPLETNLKVVVAQRWLSSCLQPDNRLQLNNHTFSEDCLYLNIWTPLDSKTKNLPSDSKKPVLVLIHTGAFVFGSANEKHYDGLVLSALADLVVVTFNYRLNYFGFAYSDENDNKLVTSNVGMLDQVSALQWIHSNIEYFNGDPNRVTLVGQSSGGLAVGMHITSPMSRGLFQQAILISGSPLQMTELSHPKKVVNFWKNFAIKVNCLDNAKQSISNKVIKCLDDKMAGDRNKMPTMEMVKQLSNDRLVVNIPLVANGQFQPHPQEDLLEQYNSTIKSILFGFTDDEGSWIAALEDRQRFGPKVTPNLTLEEARQTLREYLDLMDTNKKEKKEIVDYYLTKSYKLQQQQPKDNSLRPKMLKYNEEIEGELEEEEEEKEGEVAAIPISLVASRLLTSSLGDHYITCPLNRFADQLAKKNVAVYQYYWKYKGNSHTSRFWNIFENAWCGRWMGTCHSFEMYALFGQPLLEKENFDQNDRIVTKKIIEIVKEFCHRDGILFWSKFNPTSKPFIQIDASLEVVTMGQNLKNDVCSRLWYNNK